MFNRPSLSSQAVRVFARLDEILGLWIEGQPLEKSIQKIFGDELTLAEFYKVVHSDPVMHKSYKTARELKSHYMIDNAASAADFAVRSGRDLNDFGGLRTGIGGLVKVAGKINPEEYSDRIELTGAKGGPVDVKGDMTITPSEAYERMVKGE